MRVHAIRQALLLVCLVGLIFATTIETTSIEYIHIRISELPNTNAVLRLIVKPSHPLATVRD
jgi:hypothetical protein